MSAADVSARALALQTRRALWRNSRRVVVIGDSFLDTYGYTVSATTTTIRSSSAMGWLQFLSGGQLDYGYAGQMRAVGGQTSTAALNTAYGGAAAVLDATSPGIAIWQPGTNDWQLAKGADDTIANDKAFLKLAQARGVRVVLVGIAPRGGWTDSPDTATALRRRQWIARVNAWRQAAARMLPGVAYADTTPGWADAASTAWQPLAVAVRTDSLHPSDGWGAYYLGLALWKAFQSLGFGYAPDVRCMNFAGAYDAVANPYGNRLANQNLNATTAYAGGGATSGGYPTGFVLTRSAGTVATAAGSQVARADGYPGTAQQYVFAVPTTGGGANEQFRAEQSITAFTAGETIVGSLGVNVVSATGLRVPELQISALDGSAATLFSAWCFESTGTMPNIGYTGVLKTDPFVVPAGTASLRMRMLFTIDGTATTNGAVVQIMDPFLGRPPAAGDIGA